MIEIREDLANRTRTPMRRRCRARTEDQRSRHYAGAKVDPAEAIIPRISE
jgi:hypothetical protein